MVPGAGIEPARPLSRGILSPLCLPIPPPGQNLLRMFGGWGRNRTGVHGFAGRCITTLPLSQKFYSIFRTMENWSGKPGSNRRPIPWQGIALPTELFPRFFFILISDDLRFGSYLNFVTETYCSRHQYCVNFITNYGHLFFKFRQCQNKILKHWYQS